jgi:hypothetical protein
MKKFKVKKKQPKKALNINATMYRQEFNRLKESHHLPSGITTLEKFYEYKVKIREIEEAENKRRDAKHKLELRKSLCIEINQKLKQGGFGCLVNNELISIASVVEQLLSSGNDLLAEEMTLIETALGNSSTFRYLQLKMANFATANQERIAVKQGEAQQSIAAQQAAIMEKLSEISAEVGNIKTGSVVSGMWAVGEGLGGSFGGE